MVDEEIKKGEELKTQLPEESIAEEKSSETPIVETPTPETSETEKEVVKMPAIEAPTPEAPIPEMSEVKTEPEEKQTEELEGASKIGEGQPSPQPEIISQPSQSVFDLVLEKLKRAREAIQFRRRKKLERILSLARQKGKIKNDDLEKLLHISDATATRYLSQLVREGRLRQVGPPNQAFYEPI